MILIVAGVSGCGKSTVGALLAGRLHWRFADADTFHTEANIAKMRAGIPLDDADRGPWLQALAAWMDEEIAAGESAVLACSALKRAYRDVLLDGRPGATMVFLEVPRDELDRRLRRSPTIAEIATHLDMAQHQIVAELEAGWSAGPRVPAPR